MALQDDIDHFCGYFTGQIETIRDLQIQSDQNREPEQYQIRFYRKVLLVNAVDTLAGIHFTKNRYPHLYWRNQERFIHFIREGSCWAPGEYVSFPFLSERRATESARLTANDREQDREY